MEMKLDELLTSISLSVQQAEQTIDKDAADTFLLLANSMIESVPGNKDNTKVPIAALMHHKPLLLDEVNVRMNAFFRMEHGNIYVETTALQTNASEETLNENMTGPAELVLTYRGSETSEGIARITNQLNRNL